jgi:pectate lyase
LNLSADEVKNYPFVVKYENPTHGYTNPTLEVAGVSKLDISNTNGLTIFSTQGNTIKHVELKLQASSNDIVIRNLNFDEMWQWDDG